MQDPEIIDLYFARSEQAVTETAKKYGAYLAAIANNILHHPEDTEEVVSDIYFAVWNAIPPNRPDNLKHYLSRIARNLAFKRYDYLSAEKRSADTELLLSELEECIPDTKNGSEEIMEAKELGRYINRFLKNLPENDCALFVSRFYYAENLDTLSRKFGCSPRQIKYRLQKLRKRFRDFLQEEDIL